jgi:hypothetical protein
MNIKERNDRKELKEKGGWGGEVVRWWVGGWLLK